MLDFDFIEKEIKKIKKSNDKRKKSVSKLLLQNIISTNIQNLISENQLLETTIRNNIDRLTDEDREALTIESIYNAELESILERLDKAEAEGYKKLEEDSILISSAIEEIRNRNESLNEIYKTKETLKKNEALIKESIHYLEIVNKLK